MVRTILDLTRNDFSAAVLLRAQALQSAMDAASIAFFAAHSQLTPADQQSIVSGFTDAQRRAPYKPAATATGGPIEKKKVRAYIDGCYDIMHSGHYNAIRQAKSLCDELVVGIHSNAEILRQKGPPVMSDEERLATVRACKWVSFFPSTSAHCLHTHSCLHLPLLLPLPLCPLGVVLAPTPPPPPSHLPLPFPNVPPRKPSTLIRFNQADGDRPFTAPPLQTVGELPAWPITCKNNASHFLSLLFLARCVCGSEMVHVSSRVGQ